MRTGSNKLGRDSDREGCERTGTEKDRDGDWGVE
jgi:hypothetical protein